MIYLSSNTTAIDIVVFLPSSNKLQSDLYQLLSFYYLYLVARKLKVERKKEEENDCRIIVFDHQQGASHRILSFKKKNTLLSESINSIKKMPSKSIQSGTTPAQESMDRGSSSSDDNNNDIGNKQGGLLGTAVMNNSLQSCETIEIRQDRRGCLQECFKCTTKSDFRYLTNDGSSSKSKTFARSKEEFSFVCRCCFAPCHAFDMTIKDTNTIASADSNSDSNSEDPGPEEFLEVNRPFRCCVGTCKCCCNQEATVFSGVDHLGDIRESFWCCVPTFKVYDNKEEEIYIIRPPTCWNGMCIDCTGPEGDTHLCCPHGKFYD
jgi:hypothetical protein